MLSVQKALKALIISANETDFAAGCRELEKSNRMREHKGEGERESESERALLIKILFLPINPVLMCTRAALGRSIAVSYLCFSPECFMHYVAMIST